MDFFYYLYALETFCMYSPYRLPAFTAQSLRQIKGKTQGYTHIVYQVPRTLAGFSFLHPLASLCECFIHSSLKGVRSQAWGCIPFITALWGSEIYILIQDQLVLNGAILSLTNKQESKQTINPTIKMNKKVFLLCFSGRRSLW